MEIHVYLAFIAATTLMIALPGPSVMLTVAHSMSFGWRRTLVTVTGETAGIAVQLIIAAVGLNSLLHSVAGVFAWIRWAGAVYLVYLGIRQWKSAADPVGVAASSVSRTNLFVQGLVITIFNPKSLIFIAAFLPQFIDAGRPPAPQLALIVPTFLVITFVVTSAWAAAAGKAGGFLQSRRAVTPVFRAAGGLMVLAGAGLALSGHGS